VILGSDVYLNLPLACTLGCSMILVKISKEMACMINEVDEAVY
jgi:hypothetical protein